MKQVLVDTDILSYYLFKNYPIVKQNIEAFLLNEGFIHIGRPTIFEIESGLKAKNAISQLSQFHTFIEGQQILEITQQSAQISANIYAHLYNIGKHTGVNDLYLAGIALENDLIISTNNEKDYQFIPDLEIINWTKG
ncbi:MAG: type II toxin-antitoxin system VapC family toxin [Microscillaceae bacterium]|nr:type II toxin-antitoxin system VapC family toxin [Microscillaceae bacterium]